jgi:hypothetical protein
VRACALFAVSLACRGDARPPAPAPAKEPIVTKRWTAITERASAPAMTLYGLASDGAALYWKSCPTLAEPCTLWRLAHDATTPVALATARGLGAFAVDADQVYVAAGDRILVVAKTRGVLTELPLQRAAYDVAAAGYALYVSFADTRKVEPTPPDPRPGQILWITGSSHQITPEVMANVRAEVRVASHSSSMPRLVADDRAVYFTGDDGVSAWRLGDGAAVELAHDDRNPPQAIAISDDTIYFTAGGELRRIAKTGGPVAVLYRAQILLGVRADGGDVFVARNVAFDRGAVAERGAIVRIRDRTASVVAELDASPRGLAIDASGVYALLVAIGPRSGRDPDRIVAYPR